MNTAEPRDERPTTYRPRLSEKLIPSLIFPPTTERSRAPVTVPPAWSQHCRKYQSRLYSQSLKATQNAAGCSLDPRPQSYTSHLNAPGILRQHLFHLVCFLGFLKYLKENNVSQERVSECMGPRSARGLYVFQTGIWRGPQSQRVLGKSSRGDQGFQVGGVRSQPKSRQFSDMHEKS